MLICYCDDLMRWGAACGLTSSNSLLSFLRLILFTGLQEIADTNNCNKSRTVWSQGFACSVRVDRCSPRCQACHPRVRHFIFSPSYSFCFNFQKTNNKIQNHLCIDWWGDNAVGRVDSGRPFCTAVFWTVDLSCTYTHFHDTNTANQFLDFMDSIQIWNRKGMANPKYSISGVSHGSCLLVCLFVCLFVCVFVGNLL